MSKKRTVVRIFNAERQKINGVTLTILRLEKEVEFETRDFYELLADIKERYRNTPGKVVVVIEDVRGPREARRVATISTIEKASLLFPEPVRLKAIYVAKDVRPGERKELSKLDRFVFNDNVYIYHGSIDLDSDAALIVLDTEAGMRVISKYMLGRRSS